MTALGERPSLYPFIANTIDPHDCAAIEALASSGLWKRAGLLEARRLQELLKQRECLEALTKLGHVPPETEPARRYPDSSQLKQIESELTEDLLTLFDDTALTREQTLSLLGQVSVLVELVKRRQLQKPTKNLT